MTDFCASFSLDCFSLRVALLNEVKEVRAAGLRALRYLIHDSNVLKKVLQLQVDYLISRWVCTPVLCPQCFPIPLGSKWLIQTNESKTWIKLSWMKPNFARWDSSSWLTSCTASEMLLLSFLNVWVKFVKEFVFYKELPPKTVLHPCVPKQPWKQWPHLLCFVCSLWCTRKAYLLYVTIIIWQQIAIDSRSEKINHWEGDLLLITETYFSERYALKSQLLSWFRFHFN